MKSGSEKERKEERASEMEGGETIVRERGLESRRDERRDNRQSCVAQETVEENDRQWGQE